MAWEKPFVAVAETETVCEPPSATLALATLTESEKDGDEDGVMLAEMLPLQLQANAAATNRANRQSHSGGRERMALDDLSKPQGQTRTLLSHRMLKRSTRACDLDVRNVTKGWRTARWWPGGVRWEDFQ